jgi:hypothetical protein
VHTVSQAIGTAMSAEEIVTDPASISVRPSVANVAGLRRISSASRPDSIVLRSK